MSLSIGLHIGSAVALAVFAASNAWVDEFGVPWVDEFGAQWTDS